MGAFRLFNTPTLTVFNNTRHWKSAALITASFQPLKVFRLFYAPTPTRFSNAWHWKLVALTTASFQRLRAFCLINTPTLTGFNNSWHWKPVELTTASFQRLRAEKKYCNAIGIFPSSTIEFCQAAVCLPPWLLCYAPDAGSTAVLSTPL